VTLEIGEKVEQTQTAGELGPDDDKTPIFGRVTGKLENDCHYLSVSIKYACISGTVFVGFYSNPDNYSDNNGGRTIQPGSNVSGTMKTRLNREER